MSTSPPANSAGDSLSRIIKSAQQSTGTALDAPRARGSKLPPVHLWNPPFCGDLDMRIAHDGTWYYQGSPIGRKRMVRLFSTILRHDEDGKYYLVTPVEKIGITVDDAPFIIVNLQSINKNTPQQEITLFTNTNDEVLVDKKHPLWMAQRKKASNASTDSLKEMAPYVRVRARLNALVGRAVFYDLVALGCEHRVNNQRMFGIWSCEQFFPLAHHGQY